MRGIVANIGTLFSVIFNIAFLLLNFRCEGVDSLVAYVHIDRKKEKIDSFCSGKAARPIMSNGPRLSLEFNGITSSRQSRGFKAVYSFIESK